MEASSFATAPGADLERHRRELTAYRYRTLGSPFEAEAAVRDTLPRAWRGRKQEPPWRSCPRPGTCCAPATSRTRATSSRSGWTIYRARFPPAAERA